MAIFENNAFVYFSNYCISLSVYGKLKTSSRLNQLLLSVGKKLLNISSIDSIDKDHLLRLFSNLGLTISCAADQFFSREEYSR